ncbi:MAG: hypothetical protein ABGX22_17445 [Pirellulaceae bacterium]
MAIEQKIQQDDIWDKAVHVVDLLVRPLNQQLYRVTKLHWRHPVRHPLAPSNGRRPCVYRVKRTSARVPHRPLALPMAPHKLLAGFN